MDYLHKISSLQVKASAQVAINLCQKNCFKVVALRLEKPTYGGFINTYEPFSFVSDPENFYVWSKEREQDRGLQVLRGSCYLNDREKIRRWDAAIAEQCEILTEGIPYCLRQGIHWWIRRIALEYLSYSHRQETFFEVSRYFLMNFITRGDWTEAARLDEKKLAQRLLEDEQLTVFQRYCIACLYCLHAHIPQLWIRLTQEEKLFATEDSKHVNPLVSLWSSYMNGNQEEKATKNHVWTSAIYQAISHGNSVALRLCWEELQEDTQQKMIIDMALKSLGKWQRTGIESSVKEKLVSNNLPRWQSADYINLPSHYNELIHFFLLHMDEEQLLTFYIKAFDSRYCDQDKFAKSILECFLDWPYQNNFLPTINRLWEIIPKDKYNRCLLGVAGKYVDEKTNCDYDYRSLLGTLWEETPEDFKQHMFCNKIYYFSEINVGTILLSRLLKRTPFQEKDEALFKQIFHKQPQEKRRAMIHAKEGKNMCLLLTQKEKWSFMNWLLEKSLSKEEIPIFKKKLIQSGCYVKLCLDTLEKNYEKFVEDLLDWSLELDAEKMEFKGTLIEGHDCLETCKNLLLKGKFADVNRIINFCLSGDEEKERSKVHFAQCTCRAIFEDYTHDSVSEDCIWTQMDVILAWSVDTEEKMRDLKKDLFSSVGVGIHYKLVINERLRGKVDCFYQWFELSPEEINQLKKDTSTPAINNFNRTDLSECRNTLLSPLRRSFAYEEEIISFKKEIEEVYSTVLNEGKEKEKKLLDNLVNTVIDNIREEF